MPIEIKELKVNITVVESASASQSLSTSDFAKELDKLKSKIITECTEKVLKTIKQKSER